MLTTTTNQPQPALLINYNWHHAVNDQTTLDRAIDFIENKDRDIFIEAIEADIIYSEVKSEAVMGHPPSVDGDLTLSSFLNQLQQIKFHSTSRQTECPVLKLDFKSMLALRSSLEAVKNYLSCLPSSLYQRVWINADIIAGPGEDRNDGLAQKKMQPKFDAVEFLKVVSSQLPETYLSIGWTTSLTDVGAVYTEEMVSTMISCAEPYSAVTFPVRASCFRASWQTLQKLYQANQQWTLTLWWSYELSKEDFDFIYNTLENEEEEFRNRTFYDVAGFRKYLSEHHEYVYK